jgi:hypothetical protein
MPNLYNIEYDNNQLNIVEKLQYNSNMNYKQQLNELQYKSSEMLDFTLKYNTEYYIYNYNYTINDKKCCLHTCPQIPIQPCKGEWVSVAPYSTVRNNFTFRFVHPEDNKYNGFIKLTDKFFIKSNNKYLGLCVQYQNEKDGYLNQLVAEDTNNPYTNNTNLFTFELGNNIENIEYVMLDMIYRIKSVNYKNRYIDVQNSTNFLGCRGDSPVILNNESYGYTEWVIKTSPLFE